MRRVVVTGVGVVAPNGIGKEAFWSACLNGRSGVGPIKSFDASGHPVKVAAEVPDFDLTPFLPPSQRKSMKIMSRAMRFAVAAAGLGIQDSGLELNKENPERLGVVDLVLAGGADSRIDPLLILAYTALGALSQSDRPPAEVSRPFDGKRDGFVLGEGAGVLVLEELERAKQRGAPIYAEVLGLGSSFDAYAATKPDPEAKGAARAISEALREARVDCKDVDYINAHGTSTRLNDLMETTAVKRVFGEGAKAVPMSSIKSMVGHLIGAAGAVEAAALALTLSTGGIPPTINYTQPDPGCDLDYVPNTARE